MKKIFTIFTALLLVSCSTTHDEVVVSMKQNSTTKISKEQALKNLYGELKIIDAETRADGESRRVRSIEPLVGAKTRSGNALDNDLLYIVEFEEGQGSAVVAADNRLEPVIAVLDTDVLTAEDFASDDMDDIGVYMASMIGEYADCTANSRSGGLLPAPGCTVIDTIYTANIPPMLKTKWDQESPYNDLCDNKYGTKTYAGCATIAIAQFAYYHQSPDVINGYNVCWDILALCEYSLEIGGGGQITPLWTINPGNGTGLINLGDVEVAKFVYNIGILLGLDYYNRQYGADNQSILDCLCSLGYNCSLETYDLDEAKTILAGNKPVITTGYSPISGSGHTWVIDGWKDYIIRTTTASDVEGEVGTVVPEYTITETYYDKIHCNFGWNGESDGYYIGEIFDCSTINNDIEPGIGDDPTAQDSSYLYSFRLHMFTY